MTIYLRRELVEHLIGHHFGNVDGLVEEWNQRVRANGKASYPPCRERATVYGWLTNGVPTRGRSKQQIFGLCGLLDVDPMAIIDYEKNKFFKNFTNIRMSLYSISERAFGRGASNFAPLLDMFMPGPSWPNAATCDLFYSREWCAYEFDNAGHEKSEAYGLIKVRFSGQPDYPIRSSHIAYRRLNSNDKMWRYYGLVNIIGQDLELYTEGGEYQTMACRKDGEIWFRTSFGNRPVEFRLVSLHDFSYSTNITSDMSIVGFNW